MILSAKIISEGSTMTLKEALNTSGQVPWQAQDIARKNRLAAISIEAERIRQQIAQLQNRLNALRMEKDKLQHPSIY